MSLPIRKTKTLDVKPGDLGDHPKGPINQRSEKDALNDSLTMKVEGIMKYHCRLLFLDWEFQLKKDRNLQCTVTNSNSIQFIYHRYEHNILFKDLRFAL